MSSNMRPVSHRKIPNYVLQYSDRLNQKTGNLIKLMTWQTNIPSGRPEAKLS